MSISASGCLSHPVQVHKHFLSQHCPAFSVRGWNYNNVQHKKSYTSDPNTHQTRKSSQASIAAAWTAASVLFQDYGQGAAIHTHFPLSRTACVPRGKVNPTVEAKEMREEEGTVDFSSHKKLLPSGTRHHHFCFSLLSLQTKLYQVDFTAIP